MQSVQHSETLATKTDLRTEAHHAPPKLGFVGTGWIGRLRMQALLPTGKAQCCFVHDPSPEAALAAANLDAGLRIGKSFDELLNADIDGIVIATPSALHAKQCLQALAHGKAVFCQKPLARTLAETQQVLNAARSADKLLAVDFCYRHLAGADKIQQLIASGELGDVFAVELVFHNAYGPDKPWFYNVNSAGGGCVMDLGIHLVDLAMWMLGRQHAENIHAQLFNGGQLLQAPYEQVEDYANAEFTLGNTQVRLSCSWNLHAGRDAVIEANFYGTRGGAAIRNVAGSFFDFEVFHFEGTRSHKLAGYPDDWGCRALSQWVDTLAGDSHFDNSVCQALSVAQVLDTIYQR